MSKKSSTETRRRLVLCGHFLDGEQYARKRAVWLQDPKLKEVFDSCIVLERSTRIKAFEQYPELQTWAKFESCPNDLVRAKVSISSLTWCLVAVIFFLLKRKSTFRDIVTLEKLYCTGRKNGIAKIKSVIRGLCGMGKVYSSILRVGFKPSDCLVIWSEHGSGANMIKAVAKLKGSQILLAEYGEIPGTFFVSEKGMFHESWPSQNPDTFAKLEISKTDESLAYTAIQHVVRNSISTKLYTDEIELSDIGSGYDGVIYVNAVHDFMSGLTPRCSAFSHDYSPTFASNREILDAVAQVAKRRNWLVLYKNHPNIFYGYSWAAVRHNNWGAHVRLLENVDIHTVLSASDVTISLGSKSVFLSLARGVPVLLLGPYSINSKTLRYGVVESNHIEQGIDTLLVKWSRQTEPANC